MKNIRVIQERTERNKRIEQELISIGAVLKHIDKNSKVYCCQYELDNWLINLNSNKKIRVTHKITKYHCDYNNWLNERDKLTEDFNKMCLKRKTDRSIKNISKIMGLEACDCEK